MSKRKKMIALILVAAMLAGVAVMGRRAQEGRSTSLDFGNKETLYFWYTDDALTDFLAAAAVEYYESTDNKVRVIPVLASGLEYLEAINHANFDENSNIPDLYILGNESLEKAYLAGLAAEVDKDGAVLNEENFPTAAIHAVTYHGNTVGYPLYYESSALLYNKTYLKMLAEKWIEAEADTALAQEAQNAADAGEVELEAKAEEGQEAENGIGSDNEKETAEQAAGVDAEKLELYMERLLPSTVEDIEDLADAYDAPEGVEAFFKWDVSDIFYSYFFAGNYLCVGGEDGDKEEEISIYNEDAVECLKVYQNLRQFFSIDAETISYDSVLQEFIDGKLIFTIVTTDAVAKIEEQKEEGNFPYEYGIAKLPDLNKDLTTRGLSVTDAVVVNGYSENKALAEDFARFLCLEKTQGMYERSGKVAARKGVTYENPAVGAYMDEYETSVAMPKMMATSNFWVKVEIAFTNIWTGKDVAEELRRLSDEILVQVNGSRDYEISSGE